MLGKQSVNNNRSYLVSPHYAPVRHCSECLPWINLVNPHQHSRRCMLLTRPFCRWENQGKERWTNFFKSSQLINLAPETAPFTTINQVLFSESSVRWGYLEMTIIRGRLKPLLNWDTETSTEGGALSGMMVWTQEIFHLFAKWLKGVWNSPANPWMEPQRISKSQPTQHSPVQIHWLF